MCAVHSAPCFIPPKRDVKIRFLANFRELNKHVIREPFPLPKINDMTESLENFTFSSTLDLSMGHYHLPLYKQASELYSISLLFGTYKNDRLPQGVMHVVDCFQRKMSHLFSDLHFVKVCLDDMLIHSDNED